VQLTGLPTRKNEESWTGAILIKHWLMMDLFKTIYNEINEHTLVDMIWMILNPSTVLNCLNNIKCISQLAFVLLLLFLPFLVSVFFRGKTLRRSFLRVLWLQLTKAIRWSLSAQLAGWQAWWDSLPSFCGCFLAKKKIKRHHAEIVVGA